MTHLSPHFTLEEMTKSQMAARRGLLNKPCSDHISYLKRLANNVLEPVRAHFGKPFSPSSGFRSLALNAAVGGSRKSQHTLGQAVDFEIPGVPNLEVAEWIQDNLEFDQLILEFYDPEIPTSGWVHVSLKWSDNRGEVLTVTDFGTREGLLDKSLYPSSGRKPGMER